MKSITEVAKATSLRVWARIEAGRFMEAVSELKMKDGDGVRQLTPMEEGQAGEVCRIAKLAATASGPSAATAQLAVR